MRMDACLVSREPVANAIVAHLFDEGLVPEGSVLDAGANDGTWSCMYACLGPTRQVIGLEAVGELLRPCFRPNVQLRVAALSDRAGHISVPAGFQRHAHRGPLPGGSAVNVTTIDDLFRGSRAAFLHLDLEDHEMLALRGVSKVLLQHRPILQVETTPGTRDVVDLLRFKSYTCFAVVESCGTKPGCRNVLCFPSEFDTQRKSKSVSRALRVGSLHLANSSSDLEWVSRKFPVKPWM